jgi:hypothetical protein
LKFARRITRLIEEECMAQKENPADQMKDNIQPKDHTKSLIRVAWALVVVCVVQAVLYYSLLTQAQRESEAAMKNAQAAILSVKAIREADSLGRLADSLNRENSITESRAYVGARPEGLVEINPGEYPRVTVVYENYGKVPAINCEGWSAITFAQGLPRINFRKTPSRKFMRTAVIPPSDVGQSHVISWTLVDSSHGKITDEFLDRMIDKRLNTYVYGIITYTDKYNRRDTTTFCMYEWYDKWVPTAEYNNMK